MPKFWLPRRALAELGALLLVVSMLPMFCAAKPLPLPSSPPTFDATTMDRTVRTVRSINSADRFYRVLKTSDNLFEPSNWTETTVLAVANRSKANVNEENTTKQLSASTSNLLNYYRTTPNTHHKKLEANTLPHNDQTIANELSETTAFSELNLDAMKHHFDVNETQRVRHRRRRRRHRRRRAASTEFGREPSTSNDDADDKFLSTTSPSDYHAIVTSFTTTTIENQNNNDKSTTQSVFLEFLNNFHNFNVAENVTDTSNDINDVDQQPNENGIKTMKTTSRALTLRRTRRTAHSLQTTIQRKKALRNGSEKTNLERIERSANLSLTKTTKRLQLLIKSRLLQLLPDGTVNGTQNDESEYSEYTRFFNSSSHVYSAFAFSSFRNRYSVQRESIA